jgi:site-specific recombinase XerD
VNDTAKDKLDKIISMIDGAYAPSTIRAYKSNFEKFINYCDFHQENALPAAPEIISEFIQELSNGSLKSASIRIAIASISAIHKLNRLDDPTQDPDVKIEMRRMHRKLGRESRQAYGINKNLLSKMLLNLGSDLRGTRDKAIILLAYEGMCRRSELVSIKIKDVELKYEKNSIVDINIKLSKSKTDQEGVGKRLQIGEQTKQAIIEWIQKSEIEDGYLFRAINKAGKILDGLESSQINRLFKKLAKTIELPEELIRRISGHSMRVGAAQDLLLSGAGLPEMMLKGRWSKAETVMRYVEYTN